MIKTQNAGTKKTERDRKYDEMQEDISSDARAAGMRRPVYLDYDNAGRKKDARKEG